MDALSLEYADAGSALPDVDQTHSGGPWDVAIYDATAPRSARDTVYLILPPTT